MALAVAAAAVAGTTALGMYLDAKHGIRGDLAMKRRLATVQAEVQKAVREKRISLYYRFEDQVKRRPADYECLWSREGSFTFPQAYDRVNQYAQWFISQGVQPKDLVGFYLMNSPDFVFAWIALWAVGAAPAMINYNLAGKPLIHCLKISDVKLLLAGAEPDLRARVDEERETLQTELGMKIVVLDETTKQEIYGLAPTRPDDSLRADVQTTWPLAMIYTSGTTGLPKGCPFPTERGIQRSVPISYIRDNDRWYNCMPMYHGTGGIMAIGMFWSDIHDSRSTWFTYVGETARYLLAAPPGPLDRDHCLRGMYGNGMRPDVWLKFQERFNVPEVAEFFNSTEGIFGTVNHCKGEYLATAVGHHGAILRNQYKNVFVPVLINQETGGIMRDPKTGFGTRVPYSVGGEIIVAVPSTKVFSGYYKNEDATMKKFERDVFQKGDLWYRSGDALRRTDDGRWFFMDRLGDTFRWKGENVSTAEVSEALGHFPGIVEANVYGVEVPAHDGRAGCAAIYVDPAVRATFDFAAFLKHARNSLPRYAVPVFLRIVKEMTPIHNNKQNKVPLRAEGIDPDKIAKGDGAGEPILWVEGLGKGSTFIEFKREDWEALGTGRAKL